MGPVEICKQRLESRHSEYRLWKKRHRQFGNARLVAAGLSLLGLWWVESTFPSFTWWAVGLLAVAFLASSKVFSRLEDLRRSAGIAMMFYATPVIGEKRKSASSQSDALTLPEEHPYARDVDLAEDGGLIDFLNLGSTQDGLLILANMPGQACLAGRRSSNARPRSRNSSRSSTSASGSSWRARRNCPTSGPTS